MKPTSNDKNVQQYNKIVEDLKSGNYGVATGTIVDYTSLIDTFTDLFWELDCLYPVIKNHACNFPKDYEKFE